MAAQIVTLPDRGEPEISQFFVSPPPDHVDPGPGKRPLLLFLHGRGEGRFNKVKQLQSIDAVKLHGSPAARCERNDWKQPFVVVAPQLPFYDSRWHEPRHRRAVQQIIESCAAEYGIDPNRVYATGFSIGGLGAISIALQTPCRFAGLLPVDAYDPEPSWKDRKVTSHAAIGTRIASYHSSANPVAQGLARLVNAKTVVRYCPGDHVQICRDVYACDAVYDWLRGATENGAPFVSEFV